MSTPTAGRLVSAILIAAVGAAVPAHAAGRKPDRTEIDALAAAPASGRTVEAGALARAGRKLHVEERLGVPTFLWAAKPGEATSWNGRGDLMPVAAARRHLAEYSRLYGLKARDLLALRLDHVHNTGTGAVIAKFRQNVGGVEVFRDQIAVVMDRQLRLIAISGYVPAAEAGGSFALSAADAVARAVSDFAGDEVAADAMAAYDGPKISAAARAGASKGGYEYYDLTAAGAARALGASRLRLAQPVRSKQMYFHGPDGLEPAYYAEVDGQVADDDGPSSDYFSYVISAVDGRVLFRHNLSADVAFRYRVWADTAGIHVPYDGPQGNDPTPHPTGVPDGFLPPYVAQQLLNLQNGPISTNDAWLPNGQTETSGNNVDAYVDLSAPDGYSNGDLRATTTATNAFDRLYDPTLAPNTTVPQQMAAVTQLFYDNNFFHDWYYDAGFNEAAGNGQTNNFGRGGLGGDSMRSEAQDFSGLNNANMSTPADGGRPRMQMYIFNGRADTQATDPGSIAGKYPSGTAAFGLVSFSTTAEIVWVDDGVVGAAGSIHDGCETPFVNAAALAGKIAFIDRGGPCAGGFLQKAQNAQANGAIGVIVANVAGSANPSAPPNMGGTGAVTIGAVSMSFPAGELFRAQFGSGPVMGTIRRLVPRDGTIDNQIVAHEWGHFISNRLIGNASGLSNTMGRGMGEGWGDFHAMLLTVRPEDALAPANANFNGVYALAGYASDALAPTDQTYYFGIRRLPYSTDMTKDPLTYQHIQNGVPLPAGVPLAGGADGANNAEVHNTGEVWATMLWESYAALLRDTLGPTPRLTFDQARSRMIGYLVGAYKATPNAPTLVEARDALFAAAFAGDPQDFALFCQAFAKRGAGLRAVAPDRSSTTNVGVVESYVCGNDLAITGTSLIESAPSCDHDGYVDNGETGTLTVTLKNVGSGALSHTTATVTSGNAHVTLGNGGLITFPATEPYATTSASIDVHVDGATDIEVADFEISVDDPDLAFDTALVGSFATRINADDVPDSSATDNVESKVGVWTAAGNAGLSTAFPWRRLEVSADQHRWFGPNAGAPSDQYLISPVLHVGHTGSFGFTFTHRYSFEAPLFDGGVIEISSDGGAHWTDIGGSTSPGYNGTLVATGTNPLAGRPAFVNNSAGYPAFINATVSLGGAYDGMAVQVRFRIGADDNTAAAGWDIDDIAFSGIENTPFHTIVPHQGHCDCAAIHLTPATLPESDVNAAYPATTITPSGGAGPYTFNVAGLPPGLTPTGPVVGDDVTIEGTATAKFEGTVTISGTDGFACPFSQDFALRIGTPTVTINDVSVNEGNDGTTPAVFTVTLSHPTSQQVTVRWKVVGKTAEAGSDFVDPGPSVLTFAPMTTSQTISIDVMGDTLSEPNETFQVRLTFARRAKLSDRKGIGTIVNDDTP